MKPRRVLIIFLLSLLLASPGVCPAQEFLPANVSAALIFKILTYDRSLPDRFDNELSIGIVYDREKAVERDFARGYIDGLRAGATKFKSGGLTARIEELDYSGQISADELAAMIREKKIGVLVSLSADGPILQEVSAAARAEKVNSICLQEGCLDYGIGFGVLIKGNKPKMFVNIPRTREEGSNYSSKLLALCEKVE